MDRVATTTASSGSRLIGIDSARYLLCLAVALLHSLPGTAGHTTAIGATLIASACRAAVPFFFIASGYFMRVPPRWTPLVVTRPLARLLPVYVAWFLIYAAIDALALGYADMPSVRSLLTGGSGFHLWFIPVLGVTLAALPTSIVMVGHRATTLMAIALAMLGLALGAYHGVLHLHEVGGIRLTMAPALVLIGHWFARCAVRPAALPALVAVVAAAMLVMAEETLIAHLTGAAFTSHDIVVMTYPLGAALFALALGVPASRCLEFLAQLGRISLGVYAAHLMFVRLLLPVIGQNTPARALALAIAATVSATALCLVLDRVPVFRKLVR
jgi:surface polysaccharide O-acyltransferase-like enzyme